MNDLLYFFAVAQIGIGCLMFALPRLLDWRPALEAMPTLLREVYYVHAFFLSFTLWIFGGLTLAYGDAIGPLGIGIGLFWAARVVVQLFYYDSSHWRGKRRETVIHFILLGLYGAMSVTYLMT
ncbi:MAG: hypothetical protein AAGD14_00075 [Planctomycetota bacterium]